MAKRQTNRKVIIRFVVRNTQDPLQYLNAVEAAFRPKEIEISVDSATDVGIPDEQLETEVSAVITESLDAKDAISQPPSNCDVEKTRQSIMSWILGKISSGWQIVATVVPVLEKLKKLIE